MYFILVRLRGIQELWQVHCVEGTKTIRLFDDLELANNRADYIRLNLTTETKVYGFAHTIKEQLLVADKLAKLNNSLIEVSKLVDYYEEINNATTGEPQQP